MSYQLHILDGLFVLRWGHPEPGDPTRYVQELTAARMKQRKTLVGLFIMPEGSPAPGDEFKKEQARVMEQVMDNLNFAVAVFEGSGFATAMKRSALIAILLLTGKRQKISVRSTVRDALVKDPPGELGFDGARAYAQVNAQGLCDVPYEDTASKTA